MKQIPLLLLLIISTQTKFLLTTITPDSIENNTTIIGHPLNIAQLFLFTGITQQFGSVTAPIARWDTQLFLDEGQDPFIGRIVLVRGDYAYNDVPLFMSVGAAAVIVGTSLRDPGRLSLSMGSLARVNGWDTLVFQLSIYEEYAEELWELFESDAMMIGMVTDEGNGNRWEEFSESTFMIIFQIVLVIYSLVPVGIVIYIVVTTERRMTFLAKAVLLTEFLLGIYRTLFFAWDPVNIRKHVRIEVNLYLAQVTAPFSVATTIGVLLFWNIVTKYNQDNVKIKKYCSLGFIIFVLAFGFIFFPLTLIFLDSTLTYTLGSLVYLLFALILSTYTFITVPSILKVIDKSPRKDVLIEKTVLVTLSGIFSFLWCIPPLIFVLPSFGYAETIIISWMIWFILLVSISTSQVLVFRLKKTDRTTVVVSKDSRVKVNQVKILAKE